MIDVVFDAGMRRYLRRLFIDRGHFLAVLISQPSRCALQFSGPTLSHIFCGYSFPLMGVYPFPIFWVCA
jgi:hypothetical protein